MNKPESAITLQDMGHIEKIHFVGIGGTGMSGIAEVLLNLGFKISGSDQTISVVTERLIGLGAVISSEHKAVNVECADVVVVSSAVDSENIEIKTAQLNRIPVIPRAEMLAELMRFRYGIAIAGTHGKTTTTSLIANMMAEGDLDPTFVIGGRLNSSGANAKLGLGHYLVAEADESDASFLHLQPMIAVVTNIDRDHMETYEGNYQRLQEAFVEFLSHLPFYGLAVVCVDDPGVELLLPKMTKPYRTYGLTIGADVCATKITQSGLQTTCQVQRWSDYAALDITLNMPGLHNLQNALAAITVATHLNISDQAIRESLKTFTGVGRRFQITQEFSIQNEPVTLVDDYGHHPREIEATLGSLKQAWPKRRAIIIFQPHRYSRTRDLFEDFVRVLSSVDILILLEVYSAGEDVIAGTDGRALAQAIRARGQVNPVFVEDRNDLLDILEGLVQPKDVVLTLGAGSVSKIAAVLSDALPERMGAMKTAREGWP